MKISKLLNYLLVSFVVLILILITYSIYISNRLSDLSAKIYYHPFAVTNEIKNINININNIENILDKTHFSEKVDIRDEIDKINIYENQIENSLSIVQDRYSGDKDLVLNSITNFNRYKKTVNINLRNVHNNLKDTSISVVETDYNSLKNSLDSLYRSSSNNASLFYENIDTEKDKLSISFVSFIIITVIYSFVFLFIINTKVKNPIIKVINSLEMIFESDESLKLEMSKKNEIEILIYTIGYLEGLKNILTDEIKNSRMAEQRIADINKELKDTMELKEKLFSVIAHDLINPFHAIIGFSQYLKEDFATTTDEEKMEMLTHINQSAIIQHNLLKNLLEWSKSQLGEMKIEKEVLNVNTIINEAFSNVKLIADAKEIELTNKSTHGLLLYADKRMLTVILNNLLTNSIKFSYKKGEIIVTAEEDKIYTTIKVIDKGCGIEKESINTLFDIHKNNLKTGTAGEKGSGLGLTICKDFVNRQGGKIFVESEVKEGSTISISLPKEMYKAKTLSFS